MTDPKWEARTGAQLSARLLNGCSFRPEWLAEGEKEAAPLGCGTAMDAQLARRLSTGARRTGHDHVIAARLAGDHGSEPVLKVASNQELLLTQLTLPGENLLVALPDLSGALLVTGHSYAVIGGVGEFLQYSLPEGVERARANFQRYAKRIGSKRPEVAEATKLFPLRQRAWAKKSDVLPGSATAEQLALMEAFAYGDFNGSEFATAWLSARHRSLATKERLREPLGDILADVFYALENYSIDPSLQEPGDLTNEQLKSVVRNALAQLDSLEHG
ncbi:colicin immunity domain-containing protein [Streptomyces orinoci]|uniref:Colicin immunity domain-containing protein n=1 Tax=Streptomyces orinoci TaxID=67339 RepID=A0ABV3K505_STRON|nr:colicin immunity domain-containing protein [Streptomyces orinoci]